MVRVDGPGRGRLGRADRGGVPKRDALLADHDDLLVQVHVDPPQPSGLTPAQATEGDEPPHREQPVISDEAQELGE
jgi:hypothetical protein